MRHLFLHIGMHKTGSSSIQQTLASCPQNGSVIYASLGQFENHSVPFNAMFSHNPDNFSLFKKQGKKRKDIFNEGKKLKKSLLSQIKEHNSKNFIISGEGIVHLNESELSDVLGFFKPFFDEIIVCAYIRPPIAFMESAFQERVKNGVSNFDIKGPKYRNKFEKFEMVFGKYNVLYWPFIGSQLKDKCVVSDFCERTGFDLDGNDVVNANEGLCLQAIALLFKARKEGFVVKAGNNSAKNWVLIDNLKTLQGQKLRFGEDLSRHLVMNNQADIDWMQSRVGLLVETRKNDSSSINTETDLIEKACDNFTSLLVDLTWDLSRYQKNNINIVKLTNSKNIPNLLFLLIFVGFADKTFNNKFSSVSIRFFRDWYKQGYSNARHNVRVTYARILLGLARDMK